MIRPTALALTALALLPAPLRAGDFLQRVQGMALGGYDAVAYASEQVARRGNADNQIMWRGATWLFSSEEARATFEMSPRRYAPAFGGWCAEAMSEGSCAAPDPTQFAVIDGTLYLTRSPEALARLKAAPQEITARARDQWAQIMANKACP